MSSHVLIVRVVLQWCIPITFNQSVLFYLYARGLVLLCCCCCCCIYSHLVLMLSSCTCHCCSENYCCSDVIIINSMAYSSHVR